MTFSQRSNQFEQLAHDFLPSESRQVRVVVLAMHGVISRAEAEGVSSPRLALGRFMSPSRPFLVRSVTVTTDGVTHHGTYYVQGSVVHVRSPLGEKITKVRRSPPEATARLLLSELVREAKG